MVTQIKLNWIKNITLDWMMINFNLNIILAAFCQRIEREFWIYLGTKGSFSIDVTLMKTQNSFLPSPSSDSHRQLPSPDIPFIATTTNDSPCNHFSPTNELNLLHYDLRLRYPVLGLSMFFLRRIWNFRYYDNPR